jgi:hypothetical protein
VGVPAAPSLNANDHGLGGSRALDLTGALDRYHGWAMSEHTERLEDLSKRIASAKEFL